MCVFLENVLHGIAIDERVLMMRKKQFDGVPNVLIDNIGILFEEAGNAALRLRCCFMRTGYVPRDVPESEIFASSELNDSIRVLNFTRSDNYISEDNVSHITDEDESSFTDDLSDSNPLTYIPFVTIVDEEEKIVEVYPEPDMPGEFHISLSHNWLDVTTGDIKQFVAIQVLKQISVFQEDVAIELDSETLEDSDDWALSEDSDGMESDDEEINDSSLESDGHSGEVA